MDGLFKMLKKLLCLITPILLTACGANNPFEGSFYKRKHHSYDSYLLDGSSTARKSNQSPQKCCPNAETTYMDGYDEEEYHEPYPEFEERARYDQRQDEDEEGPYEQNDGYEENYPPKPRDRCAIYGLKPGSLAHRDCQRQLYSQHKKQRFYRR